MVSDITLRYTMTEKDLVRSWRQHFWNKTLRSTGGFIALGGCAVMILIVAVLAPLDFQNFPFVWFALLLAVIPGLAAFSYFVVAPHSARRNPGRDKMLDVCISEDGISWRAEHIDSDSAWSQFYGIAEGKKYFLLYLSEHSFFPVPKRAFSSQEDMDSFRAIIARVRSAPPAKSLAAVLAANPPAEIAADGIVMRFRLGEKDQIRAMRTRFHHSIGSSKPSLVLYTVFAALAIYAIQMTLNDGFKVKYIVMLTPAIAVISAFSSIYLIHMRRWVRQSPAVDSDRVAVVNDKGIFIDNGLSTSTVAWSRITKIRDIGDLLILHMGAQEGLCLAKRGFASVEDEKKFHRLVALNAQTAG